MAPPSALAGKTVAVVGGGDGGLVSAGLLAAQGAWVIVRHLHHDHVHRAAREVWEAARAPRSARAERNTCHVGVRV
eukprot:2761711-Prymnesium_polylepis.1